MSNYGNMLKQMNNDRSLADTIMDSFVKEFVRDMFDDNIDPEVRFQQQLGNSERNAITTAESQYTKNLGIAIDGYQDEMDKIFNKFEKDEKYTNLKEYDKDGKRVEFKQGEKGFGLKNYGLLASDLEKAQKKVIKDRYAIFQGGEDGNISYKSIDESGNVVDKMHQSVALSSMTDEAVKRSENMLAQALGNRQQIYNLRNARQTYNQLKPSEYNQENLSTLDEIIRNMESTIEAANDDGKNTISTEWGALKNNIKDHRQTLSKVLAHDSDQETVGLQVKKVIKDKQVPMLFTKEDIESDIHKARMNKSDLKNVFGQENVSMDDAAKAVDKMVRAKDYKGAMYILDKMIPSKDTKQALAKAITNNAETLHKDWVRSDNEKVDQLEASSEVLLGKATHFLENGIVVRNDDGGWWASPQPVEDAQGQKFTSDPSFARSIANILNNAQPLSKFSTTSNARLHDSIGKKNAEIGRELIRMATVGKMGSKDIGETGWFKASLGEGSEQVVIGTQAYKNNPANKGKQVIDINSLSADQVHWIISTQLPNSNGDVNNLLNKDAMSNGLEKYMFGNAKSTGGSDGDAYTSFGGINSDLAFQEHKAFQEAIRFYQEQHQGLKGSLAFEEDALKYQKQIKDLYNSPKINSNGEFVYKDLDSKILSKPLDESIASMDEVLAGIAAVESNANPDSVNTNKDGTLDVSQYQVNSNWYRKDGKFAKRADGSDDPLYMKIQELGRKHHPKWETMTNEERDKAFQGVANEKFAKEVAESIYQTKGAYEWTTVKNGRFQDYMDDKEGYEYKEEDNIDPDKQKEVEVKTEEKPVEEKEDDKKKKNRFGGGEELDLSSMSGATFSPANLTHQSEEILQIVDNLNTLTSSNEEIFSRVKELDKLNKMVFTEQDKEYFNQSPAHSILEDATEAEYAIARDMYKTAKHLGMRVPWNLGDSYDAGYDIYRDLVEKGSDSRFNNHKMSELMAKMQQAQSETSKAIAPMVEFARGRGNSMSKASDFIDRGRGGGRDAKVMGGGYFDYDGDFPTEGAEVFISPTDETITYDNNMFMTGRDRLSRDIKKLQKELNELDPVQQNNSNLRQTFAKLNQDYQREFGELEAMTMGGTREAALAVLQGLTQEGQVFAEHSDALKVLDKI